MSPRIIIVLILLLAVTGLSACGGGGGGGNDNSGAVITLTPSRTIAVADGNDAVSVRADIKNPDGTAVADGTAVTFSASDSTGPLSTSTAVTANGSASISVNHAPITGAKNQKVTVKAEAGDASGTLDVKFINQPASVDVFIAFDQAVTNLTGLQFNMNNTAGAAFDNNFQPQNIFPMNNAVAGSSTLVLGKFDPVANSTKIILEFAGLSGFNTGTDAVIKATFAVSSGLPVFSVDVASAATFTAIGPDFGATTPPVTAANLVVTVSYDTDR